MARKDRSHPAETAPPDLRIASGPRFPLAGQQQAGVRLKEATHRLAALRVRQQRTQERMVRAGAGAEGLPAAQKG
jgi:hypothetical protein